MAVFKNRNQAGWLKTQWPWWTAGALTATAEIINYTLLPLGHPKHKYVGVTSGMARMLAGVDSTLFGHSLIATKPDYQPSIQWVIIGALIAALVLSWLEGEFRNWVRYPKGMLVATALGAFFFAWGTRVAGGCTLHHLLGGWAAMSIKSWVVMFFATVGALVGFLLLRKLNLSQYFKSQDTKWYVEQAKERGWADGLTVGESSKPSLLSWILYAVMLVILLIVIYMAFAGNNYAIQMGWAETLAKTKMAGVMLNGKNMANILMLIIVGILLGTAVAKTGFGTECGIINFELGREMEKGEEVAAQRWGMPFSLRTVMLSYQPLGALALHIAVVALVMAIGFTFFNIMEGHHWATEAFAKNYVGPEFHKVGINAKSIRVQTTLPMDIFGGLLLGFGTVLMLGCEFRNYGRTGLLYVTGLLIWPFFYVGYLPYTLARDFWDGLMGAMPYAPTTFFPALVAPHSKGVQSLIWFAWAALWLAIFFWALKRGSKNVGVTPKELLSMNSEAMYLARLEKLEKEGKLSEIDDIERDLYQQAQKV
jgi:uncharacterized membrane protein YedE/YeeE